MSITYEPEPPVFVKAGEKIEGLSEKLDKNERDFPKQELRDPEGNVIGWVRIG